MANTCEEVENQDVKKQKVEEQKGIPTEVTREMTMGEIVQNFPEAVDVMLSYGLHCVGCHVSNFESLEEGAQGHGMSEEETNKLVKEINEVIKATPKNKETVTITEAAVKKFKEYMEKENKSDSLLRIEVISGGCAGMKYRFTFADAKKEEEQSFDAHGLQTVLSQEDFTLLKGATIDYIDSLEGAGITVQNPNAESTCGCGKSFS